MKLLTSVTGTCDSYRVKQSNCVSSEHHKDVQNLTKPANNSLTFQVSYVPRVCVGSHSIMAQWGVTPRTPTGGQRHLQGTRYLLLGWGECDRAYRKVVTQIQGRGREDTDPTGPIGTVDRIEYLSANASTGL